MSNLYPPIIDSQRESIPSRALTGTHFRIPFTMPLSVVDTAIGHVQVLIQRQANMDSWSSQQRPFSAAGQVPERDVIYLPRTSLVPIGAGAWFVDVPVNLIRGINSGAGSDIGLPGFPAGGPNREGETFTVQIRFGDNVLASSLANFATWKQLQITTSAFGEWSNVQRMFVYALPSPTATLADMFSITVVNDPVAKIVWQYTPVSIDPLSQVRISYSWSTPDNYGNNFRATNLDFTSRDARGSSASGEIELGVMRFAQLTVSIDFITVNNTLHNARPVVPAFNFATAPNVNGNIWRFPIVGEEIDDGVIAMTYEWNWRPLAENVNEMYRIYRVDAMTLETVLLDTIRRPVGNPGIIGPLSTTIKDYCIEMGAEYLYFALAYTAAGVYQSTLIWHSSLTPGAWNPPLFNGYARQMNFQGNSFLTTKWQQLRLQGNVRVSNFQRNTSDQFTTTIGGEYPFYSRSARFNYRTMSIQALVSMNFDNTNTFLRFRSQIVDSQMQIHLDAAIIRYRDDVAAFPRDSMYTRRVMERAQQYYAEVTMIYRYINPMTGQSFLPMNEKPVWMSGQLWLRQNQDLERLVLRATELFTEEQFSNSIKRNHDLGSENHRLDRLDTNPHTKPGGTAAYDKFVTPVRGPTTRYDERLARDASMVYLSQRQDDIIYAERKFREAVMTWASDGQPKLFRSETEGNMIVMLSGVSFTPFNNSRHLYSLSATVTEVAEYNLRNLILYGLVPTEFISFYLPSIEFGFIAGDRDPYL